MSVIIDRRETPRDRNINSRQKFLKRAAKQVRKAVDDAITDGSLEDLQKGKVKVPVKGIDEPTFQHDWETGSKDWVAPGNKDFVEGDTIGKPPKGGGKGGQASEDGEGEDEFVFTLTQEEFLNYFFEDLELPDLAKKTLMELERVKLKRAGFTSSGSPTNLALVRTMRNSLGRRIGLGRPSSDEIAALEQALEELEEHEEDARRDILERLEQLKQRTKAIPWIDPIDVRYKAFEPKPYPISQAVVFFVMDVSGSMEEREKDIAKRFFLLLKIFLNRKYERVDVVFVRHHSIAEECNEFDFFYKPESGGTVVSTGLELVNKIIKDRYSLDDWNVYVAQASDGDNYWADGKKCVGILENLLPKVQYYAYLDIPNRYSSPVTPSQLWDMFSALAEQYHNLQVKQALDVKGIWAVFKELFKKGE